MFWNTLTRQKYVNFYCFFLCIFHRKTRLNFKRFPGVNFCQILEEIHIDYSRFNCHFLTYIENFFLQLICKILYLKHNSKIILRALLYIMCNVRAKKILLWIVNTKSLEQKVWKIRKYGAKKLQIMKVFLKSVKGFPFNNFLKNVVFN